MTHQRLQLTIQGAVQGVGFRPFIFRLATRLKLRGWVSNDTQGVVIEVEGGPERLNQFLAQLQANPPVLAEIETIKQKYIPPLGEHTFTIRPSQNGPKTTLLLPDVATCADCLRELFNPCDHRYRYPFINCTHCGPRYSIIRALPYDRGNTTMASFHMCPDCWSEYQNPLSRRFHAQPIACPTRLNSVESSRTVPKVTNSRRALRLRRGSIDRSARLIQCWSESSHIGKNFSELLSWLEMHLYQTQLPKILPGFSSENESLRFE